MQTYRRDIDGLRAVAVTPVVLFHAGVSPFSGGFVGVDVFFVISGYLITSIIAGEIAAGKFTILKFYERRVRRILPALFATLAATAVASAILLLPRAFRDFGQSAVAATLFSSNILFWREGDYFGAGVLTKPLLHTWSLAVEEQYYIVIPLLMMLLARWRRNALLWTAVICAVSFAAAQWALSRYPTAAFYLSPFRFWELGIGGLLALGAAPAIRSRLALEVTGLLGLGLIAAPVFLYSSATPFPGLAALAPCLGAALIIHSGGQGETLVSRLLGLRPVVFIGLISYSLYLWHWPIIVLYRYWRIVDPSGLEIAGLIAASVAIAALSWRYVEAPFRSRPPQPKALARGPVFAAAGAGAAAALAFGVWAHLAEGMPGRFVPEVARLDAAEDSKDPRTNACAGWAGRWISPKDACVYGETGAIRLAVWGDSHAPALAPAVLQAADGAGERFRLFARLGCAPIPGMDRRDASGDNHCRRYNDEVLAALRADADIDTVILVARLQEHVEGPWEGPGPARDTPKPARWFDAEGHALSAQDAPDAVIDGFLRTVAALRAAGKRVILVYPTPEVGYFVPSTVARLVAHGQDPEGFTIPRELFAQRMVRVRAALNDIPDGPDLVRIRPAESLCDAQTCRVMADGVPLYFDDNHLSLAGDALLVDDLAAALARTKGPAPGADGPQIAAAEGGAS
ncbi:MAG: acyltransferase family protein [Phenylobacterium sp.]|uniref:acyltransferase family protein n=1 Tax=Phenylobacterium sp. TaxID=1871053 RepID=UPI00391C9661